MLNKMAKPQTTNIPQDCQVAFESQPWTKEVISEYVWYASFGSNMLYARFLTYIKGGYCKFNGQTYSGCRDKALPLDSRPVNIPYKMYFGNKSSAWGPGGVSFLDLHGPGEALGRMYLITKEQFEDIWHQEGNTPNWYNEVVSLGEHEGIEVLTMTNNGQRPAYMPTDKYYNVIKMGLKETYPELKDLEIIKYLESCKLISKD